ncbi:MAG: HD domain-containing protein [Gemmatimonadales bacterium]|nr:HD domain-containing protein [Gemmatimonadales bacterium]
MQIAAEFPTLAAMVTDRTLERAKQFFFRNFERLFVLLLVASLLAINYLIDRKFAFLSFYYLPIILAGFFGGRRFAVFAGVFVGALVFFFQAFEGLGMEAGLTEDALLTIIPWGGFLILTGYVVGGLAEQRAARLADLRNAYLATLEVLTFHIESTENNQQGHSTRVADLAAAMGAALKLSERELENLRIAALLHEVGTADQRVLRLLSRSVTDARVTVASALRGAAEIIAEYTHYYEVVGDDWDIEALPIPLTVKILAVADAFETLQMATPVRQAFTRWNALEEVEKGAGKTFAREPVRALRVVAGRPELAAPAKAVSAG